MKCSNARETTFSKPLHCRSGSADTTPAEKTRARWLSCSGFFPGRVSTHNTAMQLHAGIEMAKQSRRCQTPLHSTHYDGLEGGTVGTIKIRHRKQCETVRLLVSETDCTAWITTARLDSRSGPRPEEAKQSRRCQMPLYSTHYAECQTHFMMDWRAVLWAQ